MYSLKNPFSEKVIRLIKNIPAGRVATYGQIADLAGKPQGSRGVAWILHACSTTYKLPWHRVINAQGKISFDKKSRNYREQKRRLEKEGVIFSPEGKLRLSIYQWKKKRTKKKTLNTPKMFGRK